MKKRILAMALALVLVACVAVAGTVAWLSANTGPVTNTFKVGDINIELDEHALNTEGTTLTETKVKSENNYKILPGTAQPKDPFVTVKANSEDCYVFVQVKEVNNTVTGNANADKYITWAIANGWTKLGTTVDGVSTYYRTTNYATSTADVVYNVLAGDVVAEGETQKYPKGYVSYDQDLIKANLNALDKDAVDQAGHGTIEEDEMPKLIFKAFAIQTEVVTPSGDAAADATAAWNAIDPNVKLTGSSNP